MLRVCVFFKVCSRDERDRLVCASTLGIGPNIYTLATALRDKKSLACLTVTDKVTMKAKYIKSKI